MNVDSGKVAHSSKQALIESRGPQQQNENETIPCFPLLSLQTRQFLATVSCIHRHSSSRILTYVTHLVCHSYFDLLLTSLYRRLNCATRSGMLASRGRMTAAVSSVMRTLRFFSDSMAFCISSSDPRRVCLPGTTRGGRRGGREDDHKLGLNALIVHECAYSSSVPRRQSKITRARKNKHDV